MTQKDNVSMSPLVRFWGVLVFCFLFLVAGILCLGLFPAEPHFSKKTNASADVHLAEIPLIEDLVAQEDASLPIVEVSYREGKKIEEDEIILAFDKIQIGGFQELKDRVSARGGFDNREWVSWETTKELPLSFT